MCSLSSGIETAADFKCLTTEKERRHYYLHHLTIWIHVILQLICMAMCAYHYVHTEFNLAHTIILIFVTTIHLFEIGADFQYKFFGREHVLHLNSLLGTN